MQASSSQFSHQPVINPHAVYPYVVPARDAQHKRKPAQYPWHSPQPAATLTEQSRRLHAKLLHVLGHPDTARGWVLLLGVPKHITKTWFRQLGLDSRRVLIVYEDQLINPIKVAPMQAALGLNQVLSTQTTTYRVLSAYEHWLRQSLTNATCSVVIDATSPTLRRASLGQALGAQFGVRYITLPLMDHGMTNHDESQPTKYKRILPTRLQISALKTTAYQPC